MKQLEIFPDEVEPYSRSLAHAGSTRRAVHTLKHEPLLGNGDAHAVVGDDKLEPAVLLADAQRYRSAVVGVFAGIGKKIVHY